MKLDLKILNSEPIVSESLLIQLQLTNDTTPVEIPFQIDELGLVTLILYDEKGNLMAEADGRQKIYRRGGTPPHLLPENLDIGELPPNETIEIDENLLEFMDIAQPGTYFLQARFVYAESGINAESAKAPFEVKSNECDWADYLVDQICAPVMFSLQHHADDNGSKSLLQISNPRNPEYIFGRINLKLPPQVQPMISQADFTNALTFEHDLFRWIAWTDKKELYLVNFDVNKVLTGMLKPEINFEMDALLGRPIQHEDKGGAVLLSSKNDETGYKIHRLRFDQAGKTLDTKFIKEILPTPYPSAVAADWRNYCYLIHGSKNRLPVFLHRFNEKLESEQRLVLTGRHFRVRDDEEFYPVEVQIMCVQVDVKTNLSSAAALVIASVERPVPMVYLARYPLETYAEDILPSMKQVPLDFLEKGETVVTADIAQTVAGDFDLSSDFYLFALLGTSMGRVFAISPNEQPLLIKTGPQDKIRAVPRLIRGEDGSVHAFISTESSGMQHQVIYTPPIV